MFLRLYNWICLSINITDVVHYGVLTYEPPFYADRPLGIPGEPTIVDSGKNHVSLTWLKPEALDSAPVISYRVEVWEVGCEGGAQWKTLGSTPLTSFDAFNLKPGAEYHFRVTPKNRFGFGESVATSCPVLVGAPLRMPEFTKILPGQMKALLGKPLTLECSLQGHPRPIVLWYKDGREVVPSDGVEMRSVGNTCRLSLSTVQWKDSGRYTCEATNKEGRVSTFVRLFVVDDPRICDIDSHLKSLIDGDASLEEYPPQITMRLRDRRVQVTYPVRLTCQVIGSPSPGVTWFKDGVAVILNGKNIRQFLTTVLVTCTNFRARRQLDGWKFLHFGDRKNPLGR